MENRGKLLIIGIVLIVFLSGYLVYSQFIKKDAETNNTDTTEEIKMTEEDARKAAQTVYSSAYANMQEGNIDSLNNVVNKTYNGNSINCLKIDFTPIKHFFTEEALNYIKGNYYLQFEGDNEFYQCKNNSELKPKIDFVNSIFGITQKDVRKLEITSFTSNYIIATGKLDGCPIIDPTGVVACGVEADEKPFNITFKKAEDKWLIDSFD